MTIIFDDLRINTYKDIQNSVGEKATVDKLRWANHEVGNKPYFDADYRLNKEQIEITFKPIPKDEILSLRNNKIIQQLYMGIPEFRNAFPGLEKSLLKEFESHQIIDLTHFISHSINIGHTPKEELLTFISESIIFKSDSFKHLAYGTYLSKPPLSAYMNENLIRGIKFDDINIDLIYKQSIGTAEFYMNSGNYVDKKYINDSWKTPIVDNSKPTSPVQVTWDEVFEVVTAAKFVETRAHKDLGKPLSEIKLLDLPKLPAKLFTLSDEDRFIIKSLVYPHDCHPDVNNHVKNNFYHTAKYLDNVREQSDKFIEGNSL